MLFSIDVHTLQRNDRMVGVDFSQDNLVIIIAKARFNIYLFTLVAAIYSGSPDILQKRL